MGAEGRELSTNSGGKQHVATEGGALSGALSDDSTPNRPAMDPDLADVVTRWPTLPLPIKAGILAMVRAT
jgi:hypothetical protein